MLLSCKVLRWSYHCAILIWMEIFTSVLFTNRVLIHPVSKNRASIPPSPHRPHPQKSKMNDKGNARKYLDFLFHLNIGGSRPSDKGVGGGLQISFFSALRASVWSKSKLPGGTRTSLAPPLDTSLLKASSTRIFTFLKPLFSFSRIRLHEVLRTALESGSKKMRFW